MGRSPVVRVAAATAAVLVLSACGTSAPDDDTAVLGVVIDRESETSTVEERTSDDVASEAVTPAVVPTSEDDAPETTTPEPAPEPVSESEPAPAPEPPPSPTAEPTPSPTRPPAEMAESGEYPSGTQVWTIDDDGQASQSLATKPGQTYERNADGTVDTEPDLFGDVIVEAAGERQIVPRCVVSGQADDHRELRVAGTVTVAILVDGDVVATTTAGVETVISPAASAMLVEAVSPDPVTVGEQSGDAVELTCRVSFQQ